MPRRQIAIKHLLLATFWCGVSLTAWGGAYRLLFSQNLNDPGSLRLVVTLATFGWSVIFVAIDTLIGHEKRALVIGAGMWAMLLVLSYLFLV